MKKFCLLLVAVLMVHIGFACKLDPPPTKVSTTNTSRCDTLDNKCNLQKDKATIKDAVPEKKKPHYRRIVLILV